MQLILHLANRFSSNKQKNTTITAANILDSVFRWNELKSLFPTKSQNIFIALEHEIQEEKCRFMKINGMSKFILYMFDKMLPHSRNMAVVTLAQWQRTERMTVHSEHTEYILFGSCERKNVHYHFTSTECSIFCSLFAWHLLMSNIYYTSRVLVKNAIPAQYLKPQNYLMAGDAKQKQHTHTHQIQSTQKGRHRTDTCSTQPLLFVHSHFFL